MIPRCLEAATVMWQFLFHICIISSCFHLDSTFITHLQWARGLHASPKRFLQNPLLIPTEYSVKLWSFFFFKPKAIHIQSILFPECIKYCGWRTSKYALIQWILTTRTTLISIGNSILLEFPWNTNFMWSSTFRKYSQYSYPVLFQLSSMV